MREIAVQQCIKWNLLRFKTSSLVTLDTNDIVRPPPWDDKCHSIGHLVAYRHDPCSCDTCGRHPYWLFGQCDLEGVLGERRVKSFTRHNNMALNGSRLQEQLVVQAHSVVHCKHWWVYMGSYCTGFLKSYMQDFSYCRYLLIHLAGRSSWPPVSVFDLATVALVCHFWALCSTDTL